MRPESLVLGYDMNYFSQVVLVQEILTQVNDDFKIKKVLNVLNRDYSSISGQLMSYAKKSFIEPFLNQCDICKTKKLTSTLYFDSEPPKVFTINWNWNLNHVQN
jgi:hypothetical protein